ncbi:hypothetical protein Efla_001390 [Eimeria flavescens]
MKLAVATACLGLCALHSVEGANQPWQFPTGGFPASSSICLLVTASGTPVFLCDRRRQPGAQLPGAAPPLSHWWQGSVQPLPGASSVAPLQRLSGAGAPLPPFQGPAELGPPSQFQFQQPHGIAGLPPFQHFGGDPGVVHLQQLRGAGPAPAVPPGPPGPPAVGMAGGLLGEPELVQHRTRVHPGSGLAVGSGQVGGAGLPPSASQGSWREFNTGRAVADLHAQVTRLFQRRGADGSWAYGGGEVVVPVENLLNVLVGMSKLIPAVIVFCEAERMQKAAALGGFPAVSAADSFPADQFYNQSTAYTRRVTGQLQALRDLLAAVLAPASSKESVAAEIQRFRAATADVKEVYQQGSQVSSAAVGAVLPYVSTCSFFPKGDPEGTYRLWSLVGARVSSTLRYLFHVLSAMRSMSSKLTELVSGEIQPRSLLDFSRLRPLSRAASYLETAEARSASAVRYFTDLVEAYKNHTQQQAAGTRRGEGRAHAGGGTTSASPPLPQMDDLTADDMEERAELSLLADDIPLEEAAADVPAHGDEQEAVQAAQEESSEWPHGEDSGDEDDKALQTVEAD